MVACKPGKRLAIAMAMATCASYFNRSGCYKYDSIHTYLVSHPAKNGMPRVDLADDQEALVCNSSANERQIALEHVITKVFSNYGITLNITDKIRNVKLWRMGMKIPQCGGPKRKQLIEEWKETLSVDHKEVNKQLVCEKRRFEVQLDKEVSKRKKLESDDVSLKSDVKSLTKISKQQARIINALSTGKSGMG